jgi:hypothetical protein
VLSVPAHDDPSRPPRAVVPPAARHRGGSRNVRAALGDVLAHGAIEIGFQPVVDLANGRPIGYAPRAARSRRPPRCSPPRATPGASTSSTGCASAAP